MAGAIVAGTLVVSGCGSDSTEESATSDESNSGASSQTDGSGEASSLINTAAATVGGGEIALGEIPGDKILWFWAPW